MLDIKLIRQSPDEVKKRLKKRRVDPKKIDRITQLDEEKRGLLQTVEELRAQKNTAGKAIATAKSADKKKQIAAMQKVDTDEKKIKEKLQHLDEELFKEMETLPNFLHPSVPEGKDENDNEVVNTWGEKRNFDFKPKDHLTLGKALGIVEIEKATDMSGTRFYYLKGDGARLQFALIQYALNKVAAKGFTPVFPPVLVKEKAMWNTGFFPADRNEIYHVNPEDDDLYLIGTSEVPLNMLHAGDILPEKKLPLRYVGYSNCFRREAGSWGKDTHGIIRVHQFDKVEMFSFCHPAESEQEHENILAIEEEIMKELGFHYHVVNMCTGELGMPASKKYDIEVWIPTQERFRELTSCSNCTDFQARRSNIRYKGEKGNEPLHTLNGTAIATTRAIVAILENYQNPDGSVTIPEVLRPYMNGQHLILGHRPSET